MNHPIPIPSLGKGWSLSLLMFGRKKGWGYDMYFSIMFEGTLVLKKGQNHAFGIHLSKSLHIWEDEKWWAWEDG